jgi:ferric-dicitrate binding protein FerR (iron transport regulator)
MYKADCMSQHDFDKLLKKYLSGKCSAQEERVVLEWYEKLIEESSLELSNEQKNVIAQKIWSAVSQNTQDSSVDSPKGKVVSFQSRKFYRVAIAACFILLVGLGIYWFTSKDSHRETFAHFTVPSGYIHITNKENSAQVVRLDDGSEVTLRPKGSLYYPKDFQERTRDVYLTGNAFFSVAHNPNQHFIVHTEEGLLTEVLGTSFSIMQNQELRKVEVAVVTGRVLVYEEKSKTERKTQTNAVVLTPNQKAVYHPANQQLTASLVEKPKPLLNNDLHAGSFVFNETPISQVVNRLEETYGITITAENKKIDNCHFTGDISKQGLYEQLDIICQSIRGTFEVKGTEIIMKGEGCN